MLIPGIAGVVRRAVAGICFVLTTVGAAYSAQVTQNFDTEPADWIGVGNREGFNDFGWSDTNLVGFTAGEAGGAFARDANSPAFAYYADNIGSLDPSTQGFSFEGTLIMKNPQFDYWLIGYFNSADGPIPGEGFPKNFFGFYADDRFVRPLWLADGNAGGAPGFLGGPSQFGSDVNPYFFSLTYDPNGNGGTGSISGEFGGVQFSANLPVGKKDEINVLTDFGMTTRNNGPFTERQTFTFFDNLTYTVPDAVGHAGDFDGDGDVDGADFVAWQTHFPTASGATLADGDADADGDVDGADFVVWQTNFPFTPGSGVAAVPEPHAWALAAIAGLVAMTWRRRRG